jgi:hypothetical protein
MKGSINHVGAAEHQPTASSIELSGICLAAKAPSPCDPKWPSSVLQHSHICGLLTTKAPGRNVATKVSAFDSLQTCSVAELGLG